MSGTASCRSVHRRLAVQCTFLAVACGQLVVSARLNGAEIVVSSEIVGNPPLLAGYNAGHFMPGSNTREWWRYSGVNAARVWSPPQTIENHNEDDLEPYGDGVVDRDTFLRRRELLRKDPLSPNVIDWSFFEKRFANRTTSGNRIRLDYAFGALRELGIHCTAVIERGSPEYRWRSLAQSEGWADRWEHWQHYYAQAFHLARHFDIERFQVYNEPDHGSKEITQAEYLERLQVASEAIQAALNDVNRIYQKTLVPQIQAPVTAGSVRDFGARPGGDSRDDAIGWGELVVKHRHTNWLGEQDLNFSLFQTYAYQQYGDSAAVFGHDLAALRKLVSAASNQELSNFAITEFNVHTAANFAAMTATLDTPREFTALAAILAHLDSGSPNELYVFKFSQTGNFDAGRKKKNGCHYVDDINPPFNVGGVTKAGEVVRLFAKGFAGQRQLVRSPSVTGQGRESLTVLASRCAARACYFVMITNSAHLEPATLSLNCRAWNIPAGAAVGFEEVSAEKHGEVRRVSWLPQSGTLEFRMAPESTMLLTIMDHPPSSEQVLTATDDAMVKSGVNAKRNYGHSKNLWVKNSSVNASARNVSLLKFDLGSIDPSAVEGAILQVFGESVGTDEQVLAHVYGVEDDQWDEATITWNSMSSLAKGTKAITDISQNDVLGVGKAVELVGHLTATHRAQPLQLDVSRFVCGHRDQQVSFLIARELRDWGDDIDDARSSMLLAAREREKDLAPRLTLYLRSAKSTQTP